MDIATVVLALGTVFGGGGTIFLWLENHGDRSHTRRTEDTQAIVKETIEPLKDDLTVLKTRTEADGGHIATVIKAALYEALDPIKTDIATLKGDTGAMWKSLEQLSVAYAQQLHKPHPENQELDALLDAYVAWVEGDGPFSKDQELKLRKYLRLMKNYHPGQVLGFVVAPEDPTRAAALLATMELTRIRRKQEQT